MAQAVRYLHEELSLHLEQLHLKNNAIQICWCLPVIPAREAETAKLGVGRLLGELSVL